MSADYRDSSQIQLTSQVLPPSGENDCSMRAELGEMLSLLARYAHVVPQDQRAAVDRTVDVFLRRSAAKAEVNPLRIN